jgi:hypothetical protein
MPTPHPRLSVIVTADQHALLASLGALQGRSAASYVREIVDASTPHLRVLLATLQAASRSTDDLPALLAQVSAEVVRRLEPYDELNHAQLDLIADILEAHGLDEMSVAVSDLGDRERSEPVPIADADPPYSNTGVRLTGPGGVSRKKRQKTAISQGG